MNKIQIKALSKNTKYIYDLFTWKMLKKKNNKQTNKQINSISAGFP